MKLYTYWRSSAAYRVRIALNLKGIACEQVFVSLIAGDAARPGYLALNPQGLVPALELRRRHGPQPVARHPRLAGGHASASAAAARRPAGPRPRAGAAHVIAMDIHPVNNLRVLNALGDALRRRCRGQARLDAALDAPRLRRDRAAPARHPLRALGRRPGLADCCLIPQVYNARRSLGVDLTPWPRSPRSRPPASTFPPSPRPRPRRSPTQADKGAAMPLLPSWIEAANDPDCPFPLNNLPCGVFSVGRRAAHCGVAIGDRVLDVTCTCRSGGRIHRLLRRRHHAQNVGTMFRGAENALPPNWLHIPIGYNGRASSVVVSGTDITGPGASSRGRTMTLPRFAPSRALRSRAGDGRDRRAPLVGRPVVSVAEADAMIFGYVLLNDWSARDIQAWEYQPLGPFQAKATATTISPWIVTRAALEPFRVAAPERERPLLPYLREPGPMLYDIDLEVGPDPEGGARPSSPAPTTARCTIPPPSSLPITPRAAARCAWATCLARAPSRGPKATPAARFWNSAGAARSR
jgi:maleylacetoacetate isomerase